MFRSFMRFVSVICLFWLFGSSTAIAADDWQAGAGEDWKKVLAAAKKEGQVNVSGVAPLSNPLSAAFLRDTGIRLVFVSGNLRDLSTRLQREAKSGKLTTDVALAGGTELFTMYFPGYLDPIKPLLMLPGVTNSANWKDGEPLWFDNKKAYIMKTSNWVHAWAVMNSEKVDVTKIQNWSDLLKPEYKGKIAAYDPRLGGPGQSAGSYLVHQFGIEFVKRLYSGQKVVYTQDSRQLVEWAARGTYPIVLGAIQSEVERFKKAGMKQLVVPTLADGPGTLVGGFGVMTLPKGRPHPNAATVFVNWLASKPGQVAYHTVMLESSTRSDVQLDVVPEYVKVRPGVKYTLDQYSETWYKEERPKIAKALLETLGGH